MNLADLKVVNGEASGWFKRHDTVSFLRSGDVLRLRRFPTATRNVQC
jgi:hypothetical protein